jgi:hypothetical protein
MLEDQPQLAKLRTKPTPDGAYIDGTRIMVLPKGTSRRPRNVLARVEMAEELSAKVSDNSPMQDFTPEQLAHRVCGTLAGVMSGDREATDLDLALIASLGTTVEALRADYEAYHAARQEARRKAADPGHNLPPGSSLNDYGPGTFRATSVPQVPRPLSRDEWLASPEFERQRAENMGRGETNLLAGGPRQERALTGPRRFKR